MPSTPPDPRPLAPGLAPLRLRGVRFAPALFLAPMAGLTHSAFRRLVADFGGAGALWTEMLCARWLRRENVEISPATRRRPEEGHVVYQLMVGEAEDVGPAVERLRRVEPAALDLNVACPAPAARPTRAGSRLFEDRERLARIVAAMRLAWDGPLTAKIRLGATEGPLGGPAVDWRPTLHDRIALLEELGVDAVILHPRFADEKLRGRARHALYAEVAGWTRLPLLASGDVNGPADLGAPGFEAVRGVLVGRRAAERPWLFAAWGGPEPAIDHLEVWRRFVRYAQEDFPQGKAFYRIKAFTECYAGNFFFGHNLASVATGARDLDDLVARAEAFLGAAPRLRRPAGAEVSRAEPCYTPPADLEGAPAGVPPRGRRETP